MVLWQLGGGVTANSQLWHNFRDTNEALRGLRINYWVDCGTLLGLVREGDILGHDLDVDFGVFGVTKRQQRQFLTWMQALGFSLYRTYGVPKRGYEQRFKRGNSKVDIFYFYASGDNKLWHGSWWRHQHLIISEFDRDVILPTKEASFQGELVRVPGRTEDLLEARYGDWRTVQKKWRWYRDPPCIKPETLPPLREMEAYERNRR